jgi:hypothetical protein
MKTQNEFENFDATMRKLIKVPHSKIKAKLEAEKKAKTGRREASAKEKGNNR